MLGVTIHWALICVQNARFLGKCVDTVNNSERIYKSTVSLIHASKMNYWTLNKNLTWVYPACCLAYYFRSITRKIFTNRCSEVESGSIFLQKLVFTVTWDHKLFCYFVLFYTYFVSIYLLIIVQEDRRHCHKGNDQHPRPPTKKFLQHAVALATTSMQLAIGCSMYTSR